MSFFIGEYDYTIDHKGRLNLPAKFRKAMSKEANETVIITRGQEKCLDVYPLDVWQQKIVEKINHFSETDRSQRYFTSVMGANSVDSVFDKQGRITIPPKLCQYAQIEKEVRIVGAFNRIELWNPQVREQYLREAEALHKEIDSGLLP
ncbi:MAG: division/cell wall cluster transcriptional repressor MraZ [candidate division KSB1 bacterium]|nr:division/cell wall cluster transcriptional repressor MraZ [candidate division KSB1 bacterium]